MSPPNAHAPTAIAQAGAGIDEAPLTLATVHPPWRIATDKLIELCAREDAIIAELSALQRVFEREAFFTSSHPRQRTETKVAAPLKRLSAAARSLLGDLAPDEPASAVETKAAPTTTYLDPRVQHENALAAEFDAIKEAKPALLATLARERTEGSRRLCEALRGEYAAIAAQVCDAVIALGDAWIRHADFMSRNCEAELASLPPLDTDFQLGDPREKHSGFRRFLHWAAEAGWLAPGGIPTSWLEPIQPTDKPQSPPSGKARRPARLFVADTAASIVK